MNSSKSIGIVMPLATQLGGGEKMMTDLLEYGRGQSIEWTVIFLQDGPMVEQVKSFGIKTYLIQAGRLRELHRIVSTVSEIVKISRQQKFEAIIAWMPKAHVYSGLVAKILRIPCFWYELEGPKKHGRLRQVINHIHVDGVFTLSKASYNLQKQLFPSTSTRLVYPGVDLSKFDASSSPPVQKIREKLNLPIDVPIVGIVGRMQRWKGIHTLISSMTKVHEKYPDAYCLIVGGEFELEKEYFSYVKELASSLNLSNRVIFAGQQSNIPEWTQAMDIVVHASDNEPFGIVVIEAMSLGKPLVAGAQGGPTEIITPEVDGLLANYEDVETLAKSILLYLDSPEFADQVGKAAIVRAETFSIQNYADGFIDALLSMLSMKIGNSRGVTEFHLHSTDVT